MEIENLIGQLFSNRYYLAIVFVVIGGFFFMYNRKGGRKMFLAVLVLLAFYFFAEAWFYKAVIAKYVIPFIKPYLTTIYAYVYKGDSASEIFPYTASIFAFWMICLAFLKRHWIFIVVLSAIIVFIYFLLKADIVTTVIVGAIGVILGGIIARITNERFYVNTYYRQLD